MLGEDHSLKCEFPEHGKKIDKLNMSEPSFARDAGNYDALDREIRDLELKNDPIGDDAMHRLKQQRAALKDSLYKRLLAAMGQ